MDGKGRATDNAQIERFWRSVKCEEVYLREPKNFIELQQQIKNYSYYNHERPHQALHKSPSAWMPGRPPTADTWTPQPNCLWLEAVLKTYEQMGVRQKTPV